MYSNISFVIIHTSFEIVESNISISVTIKNYKHGHANFYRTMADTIASQNISLSSWITLYKGIFSPLH